MSQRYEGTVQDHNHDLRKTLSDETISINARMSVAQPLFNLRPRLLHQERYDVKEPEGGLQQKR